MQVPKFRSFMASATVIIYWCFRKLHRVAFGIPNMAVRSDSHIPLSCSAISGFLTLIITLSVLPQHSPWIPWLNIHKVNEQNGIIKNKHKNNYEKARKTSNSYVEYALWEQETYLMGNKCNTYDSATSVSKFNKNIWSLQWNFLTKCVHFQFVQNKECSSSKILLE